MNRFLLDHYAPPVIRMHCESGHPGRHNLSGWLSLQLPPIEVDQRDMGRVPVIDDEGVPTGETKGMAIEFIDTGFEPHVMLGPWDDHMQSHLEQELKQNIIGVISHVLGDYTKLYFSEEDHFEALGDAALYLQHLQKHLPHLTPENRLNLVVALKDMAHLYRQASMQEFSFSVPSQTQSPIPRQQRAHYRTIDTQLQEASSAIERSLDGSNMTDTQLLVDLLTSVAQALTPAQSQAHR